MSVTTWPAVLAWAREAVENILPDLLPDKPFVRSDGFLSLIEEPLPNFDRRFFLEGEDAKDAGSWGVSATMDIRRVLAVTVGYDSKLDASSLEDRIARDEEQILSVLLLRTGNPDGVALVEYEGGATDRAPHPLEPEKLIRTIRFGVTYRLLFS